MFLACPTLEEQSPSLQGGGECLDSGPCLGSRPWCSLCLDSQEFSPGSGSPPAPPGSLHPPCFPSLRNSALLLPCPATPRPLPSTVLTGVAIKCSLLTLTEKKFVSKLYQSNKVFFLKQIRVFSVDILIESFRM